MPSLTRTRSHSKSIVSMKTTRSGCTQPRVLDVEHGSFMRLVFTTTGGMGKECIRYHSRLAELIATKKGEQYSQTISWIRARTSFALLRSALVCLRGSRVKRRAAFDYNNCDIEIAAAKGAIDIVWCFFFFFELPMAFRFVFRYFLLPILTCLYVL